MTLFKICTNSIKHFSNLYSCTPTLRSEKWLINSFNV